MSSKQTVRHRRDRADGGGLSDDRHRMLRELAGELRRHPVVVDARGHPPSTFTEVRATLAPDRWEYHLDSGTLRVTWHPLDPREFAFHYSDSQFDCGWHHEPNPHVDGLAHYQERTDDGTYRYERTSFVGETPPELVWKILERLKPRLQERSH